MHKKPSKFKTGRVNMRVSPEDLAIFERLMSYNSPTLTEGVLRAVRTYVFLAERVNKGDKFYMESPKGDRKEVVLPDLYRPE